MDKVVFLDFDGVINSDESFEKMRKEYPPLERIFELVYRNKTNWAVTKQFVRNYLVCPHLVGNMRMLFDELPDAQFIVSSDWGRRWSLPKIKEIFKTLLPVERLDITPKKFSSNKSHEVGFWLSDHYGQWPKWKERCGVDYKVAIIDDVEYHFNVDKLFLIDDKVGLTKENVKEIVAYLKDEK